MNGTYKRSRNHRALALSVLGGIGLAFASVSSIAQVDPSKQVNTTRNPTTGYYETGSRTYRTPPGVTVSTNTSVSPTVTRNATGGLNQSMPSGITIDATKTSGPMSSTLRTTGAALKNGAARCLTSLRCTTALGLGAAGLQALLENMSWTLDDDGRPQQVTRSPNLPLPTSIPNPMATAEARVHGAAGQCPYRNHLGETAVACNSTGYAACIPTRDGYPLAAYNGSRFGGTCFYGYDGWPPNEEITALDDSQIRDGVDSSYDPDPSDWSWLTSGIDLAGPGVDIEITSAPSLSTPPKIYTRYDADGNPVEITETNIWHDFAPMPGTNPSKQPTIDQTTTETTTTYDVAGNQTGTTETVTTSPGGAVLPGETTEVPTDCDFMPTVCRFIDWFTEPDPSPDPDQEIRDLVQVYEDGGRQVELGPSTGTCPAPRVIALSFVPAVEVSFQPFCDLAAAVRFWLLAIAYFGAAYLTVRSI